jgi:hypothetical protein
VLPADIGSVLPRSLSVTPKGTHRAGSQAGRSAGSDKGPFVSISENYKVMYGRILVAVDHSPILF